MRERRGISSSQKRERWRRGLTSAGRRFAGAKRGEGRRPAPFEMTGGGVGRGGRPSRSLHCAAGAHPARASGMQKSHVRERRKKPAASVGMTKNYSGAGAHPARASGMQKSHVRRAEEKTGRFGRDDKKLFRRRPRMSGLPTRSPTGSPRGPGRAGQAGQVRLRPP
jgi:hypothetical protein